LLFIAYFRLSEKGRLQVSVAVDNHFHPAAVVNEKIQQTAGQA
jgi:hypothetical protein